jgi:hypothetical protein
VLPNGLRLMLFPSIGYPTALVLLLAPLLLVLAGLTAGQAA